MDSLLHIIVSMALFQSLMRFGIEKYKSAFITIIVMPLTYSIAEGIVFGMLSYVLIKLLTGKVKDVSVVMMVLAVLFILKFFI